MTTNAAKVVKFATCQCPRNAQGTPGRPGYVAARKRVEHKDGAGKVVATFCAACTLPISLVCKACGSEVSDIDEHMAKADSCGLMDKQWRATKARNGSPRVTKATQARTGKLLSDEVLNPGRGKAIHK